MALTRLMKLLIAASFPTMIVGCSDGFAPPEGLGLETAATPSCGPLGEPAVDIYFAAEPFASIEPDPPYVRIYIRASVDELEGRTWVLAGVDADGAASYYSTATESELASSGGIIVNEVDNDNTIRGLVDVIFPTFGRFRTNFRAEWVPRNLACL